MNTIANQSVAPVCGSGRFIARSLVVAGLLAVLAGCSLTPEYQQPVAPVPSTISEAPESAPAADLAISLQGWRDVFFDPQLQGQYAAGVMASYDLDFFGRLRSLSTEALENYLATEAAHRSAHVSLVSEIASAYLSWVGDSQLLELAQNTQATRERTVALVERQYQVGVATQLDLSQAKGALHDARSRTAEFDRLVQQDINALQFLTGSAEPLQLAAAPDDLGGIVKLADIPAALPSRVLLNRQDILAAEHSIRAANGSIGAARAAFFPRIVLTGAAGTASADLSGLFSSGTGAWSFLPRLDLPIFDFGNRQANLDLAKVRRDIRINQYERAIQNGFREVADALVARSRYVHQLDAQEDLVEEAERAYTLSSRRYETGIDSFLQVLDAQRTLFNAQQSLLATRAEQQLNLVQLYRSLGGFLAG